MSTFKNANRKKNLSNAFARYGHHCEIPEEEDVLEKEFEGNSCGVKIRQLIFHSFMVSEPICKARCIILRSHGAVVKEQIRQFVYYRYTIHPFSTFRMYWELFMVVVMLAQMIMIPFESAYVINLKGSIFMSFNWGLVRTILDCLLCIDVVVNSCTGYFNKNKNEIVLDRCEIFSNYLKGMFIVDVVSSIPTDWNLLGYVGYTTGRILRALTFLKFFRLINLFTYLYHTFKVYHVNFFVRQIIYMSLPLAFYWHFLGCIYHYLYPLKQERTQMVNYTAFDVFADQLYNAALLMYINSAGNRHFQEVYQFWGIMLIWIVSLLLEIFLLARFIELLRALTSVRQKYSEIIKELIEFMRHKQLPVYTQRRILKYYDFHFRRNYFRQNEIFSTISSQLVQEIVLQTCRQLVEGVPFFQNLPLNLLIKIASCMQPEVYLTNDVVVKANTVGDSMYFISTGTVAVYTTSGKEICHLENGAHFGEIALVMKNELRVASVVAVEVCELYRLDRRDFVKAVHPYPDLLDKIQRIAAERMELTAVLDETNRRERVGQTYPL